MMNIQNVDGIQILIIEGQLAKIIRKGINNIPPEIADAMKEISNLSNHKIVVEIPAGETTIDDFAFNGYDFIDAVVIPNNVTKIGEHAFCGCANLKSMIINENIAKDKPYLQALKDCIARELIEIPKSVKDIGEGAFEDCTSLREVSIPEKFKDSIDDIFKGCTALDKDAIEFV